MHVIWAWKKGYWPNWPSADRQILQSHCPDVVEYFFRTIVALLRIVKYLNMFFWGLWMQAHCHIASLSHCLAFTDLFGFGFLFFSFETQRKSCLPFMWVLGIQTWNSNSMVLWQALYLLIHLSSLLFFFVIWIASNSRGCLIYSIHFYCMSTV